MEGIIKEYNSQVTDKIQVFSTVIQKLKDIAKNNG
jgi:hypothetical protein